MNNVFASLRHIFAAANVIHIIWCAAVLFTMLILAVLHHCWKDDTKKLSLWRLLCLIPILICGVHFRLNVVGADYLLDSYYTLYAIPVLSLIPMLFAKRRIGYRITAVLTGILSCLSGLIFCLISPNFFNHSQESYTGSFHSLVKDMDKHYILKEWKGVDFTALEAKYMPMVEIAEKEQDPYKFAEAVTLFCNEMHDGHIYAYTDFVSDIRDYGFAAVKLDNGDVIAVCTSDEVHKLGIEDGTIITKWNGKPVLQAAAEDVPDLGIPVNTNEQMIDVMNLSLAGGDTVEVSFIDENGKENAVTVTDKGGAKTKTEAFAAFRGLELPADEEKRSKQNFSTKMLDDKCGYLILNAEETDDSLQDTWAYLSGEHKWAKEMFREKLRDLKSQGMEYLVIDLRNNSGGLDVIGYALCDLLTDREWYCQGLGVRRDGRYVSQCDQYIHGDGEFADLKVIALTNYECASAGDGTSLLLSKLPNVTLVGITDPCGCDQETGGISVLTGSMICVGYPTGLVLNENGKPNIDTAADRISRNPVEVRIPFDYDAAMKIFRDREDYELDWALNYIEAE